MSHINVGSKILSLNISMFTFFFSLEQNIQILIFIIKNYTKKYEEKKLYYLFIMHCILIIIVISMFVFNFSFQISVKMIFSCMELNISPIMVFLFELFGKFCRYFFRKGFFQLSTIKLIAKLQLDYSYGKERLYLFSFN